MGIVHPTSQRLHACRPGNFARRGGPRMYRAWIGGDPHTRAGGARKTFPRAWRLRGMASAIHNVGMRSGVLFAIGLSASALLPFAGGCSIEPDSRFGNPSGLKHDNLPSAPVAEAGASFDASAVCEGGTPPDAGCTVSYTKDIWPMMAATGVWKCADSNCHGGTALNPYINDPASAYANLIAYKINGKPYVNPCTTDPSKSTFVCNLDGTCGQQAMPVPDSSKNLMPAVATDIGKVRSWMQCGAPFN